MWNLKYDTNEHIYETETDSQIRRTDLWLPRRGGVGEERIGIWGLADVNLYIEWIITRSYYIAQETIFNIL